MPCRTAAPESDIYLPAVARESARPSLAAFLLLPAPMRKPQRTAEDLEVSSQQSRTGQHDRARDRPRYLPLAWKGRRPPPDQKGSAPQAPRGDRYAVRAA